MKSVYQSEEVLNAKENSGKNGFFIGMEPVMSKAFEGSIKLPLIGNKKILTLEGLPSINENELELFLSDFKKKSKDYFYGTVMPLTITDLSSIFKKCGYGKVDNHTILVSLNKTKEEIWNSLEKKSIRWGIKTAEKNKLSFDLANKEEIKKFYELYSSTASSGGFAAESEEFLTNLSDTLISKLFVVKQGEEIVAGGMILIDKATKRTILDLTSSSQRGLELQAMPFLYWNIILYSKSQGFDYFDLGGYDKEAGEGEKTYKINKFKERFGGEVIKQPIYATNWKYPFLRSILKKFRFMKGWYSKG